MYSAKTNTPRPLPGSLMAIGSAVAVAHLLVIGLYALAAPSGPWPVPPTIGNGESMSPGPKFAQILSTSVSYPFYLEPLRMTHNYHFNSNRPAPIAVYFEVRLKNERGEVFNTLKFPDDKAPWWIRHRQEILAQNLIPDVTEAPRGVEKIPAAGKELDEVEMWTREDPFTMKLEMVPELKIKRDQPYERPSQWSKLLAQSYMRHLAREHKAAAVELIRHSRPAVNPMMLFLPEDHIKDNFTDLQSHFGEYRREN